MTISNTITNVQITLTAINFDQHDLTGNETLVKYIQNAGRDLYKKNSVLVNKQYTLKGQVDSISLANFADVSNQYLSVAKSASELASQLNELAGRISDLYALMESLGVTPDIIQEYAKQ